MEKTKSYLNYRLCFSKFALFLLVLSYQLSCYSYSLTFRGYWQSLDENLSQSSSPNFQKLLWIKILQLLTSFLACAVYSQLYLVLVTLAPFAVICQERLKQSLIQLPLLLNSGKHRKVASDYQLTVLHLFFLNNQCN